MTEWEMDFVDVSRSTDHIPFQIQGIAAATLTQNIIHGVHYIHTPYDTVDILDLDEVDRAGDLVSEIIFRVGADFSFIIGDIESIPKGDASDDINFAAIFMATEARRRALDLAFDEMYALEINGFIVSFPGGNIPGGAVTYEEFKTFFPNIYIRREVGGLGLHSVNVSTRERTLGMGLTSLDEWDEENPPFALNEVRKVSLEDKTTIFLSYRDLRNPDGLLDIQVHLVTDLDTDYVIATFEDMGYIPMSPEITGSPYFWLAEMETPIGSSYYLLFFDGTLRITLLNFQSMDEALEMIQYLDIENDRDYYLALFGL
jgi:hypothetical protein